MTENSASLGVPPEKSARPRNVSTSHGWVSTTFQSCWEALLGAQSQPRQGYHLANVGYIWT